MSDYHFRLWWIIPTWSYTTPTAQTVTEASLARRNAVHIGLTFAQARSATHYCLVACAWTGELVVWITVDDGWDRMIEAYCLITSSSSATSHLIFAIIVRKRHTIEHEPTAFPAFCLSC